MTAPISEVHLIEMNKTMLDEQEEEKKKKELSKKIDIKTDTYYEKY
jgi:hypothetical protein